LIPHDDYYSLSSKDVEQFVEELGTYTKLFEPAFRRREQWERGQVYLKGLLGDAKRKNVDQMALEMGENVRDRQHFVGQSPWKQEPALKIHQGLIAESLSEADGVALVDESGNVKQGEDLVGGSPPVLCFGRKSSQLPGRGSYWI
jgi:SRSO17 transposase